MEISDINLEPYSVNIHIIPPDDVQPQDKLLNTFLWIIKRDYSLKIKKKSFLKFETNSIYLEKEEQSRYVDYCSLSIYRPYIFFILQ